MSSSCPAPGFRARTAVRILPIATLAIAAAWVPALPVLAQSGDVQVVDNDFQPRTLTRDPGATVTWVWTGANPHTVTSTDGRFASSAQKQGAGNTHSARFPQPGSYPYFCTVHGDAMSGTIVIRQAQQPPPSPSPTRASPRPTPAPTRTSVRPTAAASPSRAASAVPTSASARPVASTRAPSPTRVAAPATASSAASVVAQSSAPTAFPSSSTVPSSATEPLAPLDEPLPKDRSGLAIGLGLLAAAVGFGTAGALLLKRRRARSI